MTKSEFAHDVDKGLSADKKYLSSKYFYDDKGSRLFQQIMELPEYYLTDAEMDIFKNKSLEIYQRINDRNLNIIELGAGDGTKTKEFLRHLPEAGVNATYYPIDISHEAIDQLRSKIKSQLPELRVKPLVGDYFKEIAAIPLNGARNVVLFLGANIGNYNDDKAIELLRLINSKLNNRDILLLGVDLKKNPELIAKAYNDTQGVTAKFNLNLLTRINNELGGNFNTAKFKFYSNYDPHHGATRSYLISQEDQVVSIKSCSKSYEFGKDELIYTELSKKYDSNDINNLAQKSGFSCLLEVKDNKGYFADCIFEKIN